MALFLPAILIVIVDQITKYLFWSNGQNYVIIDGFFNITLVKNAGAAFGMFQGGRAFYTAVGHTSESFSDPLVRGHLLGGIQWAAGILP